MARRRRWVVCHAVLRGPYPPGRARVLAREWDHTEGSCGPHRVMGPIRRRVRAWRWRIARWISP